MIRPKPRKGRASGVRQWLLSWKRTFRSSVFWYAFFNWATITEGSPRDKK